MPYESLPNTLKANRKRIGLKQLELANLLGIISAERISMWEKGKSFPGIVNLFKLSLIFDRAAHELYPELYQTLRTEGNPSSNIVHPGSEVSTAVK
jgi:transcriptional regulator with XRE-family HTH domain